MSIKKNSEKAALYVALVASILALVLTIFTYLVPPSGTLLSGVFAKAAPPPARIPGDRGPGGPGGPGGGRMMRGFAPAPEYVQKYEEAVQILHRLYENAKNGNKKAEDVYAALLRRDEGRLNLMRLKMGRRAAASFAEAYLAERAAAQRLKQAEQMTGAKTGADEALDRLRLACREAELRLMEAERRLNPEKIAEAKAAVKEYPAELTDAQLEKLLAAEQRFRGPR